METPHLPRERAINWYVLPAIRLLIPFCTGILLSNMYPWWPSPEVLLLACCFLLLPGMARYSKPRHLTLANISVYLAILLLGIALARLQDPLRQQAHIAHKAYKGKQCLTGTIHGYPESRGRFHRVTLEVHRSCQKDIVAGKLLTYLARQSDTEEPQLYPGDTLTVVGSIAETTANTNPDAFNFRQFYARKGIYHQAFIRTGDWHVRPARHFSYQRLIAQCRIFGIRTLHHHLPEEGAAILSAMLFGYRADLSTMQKASFSKAGAMHIMAVSGLHLGIVLSIFYLILGRPNRGPARFRVFKLLCYLVGIWTYAVLTGCTASILRASTMATLWMVSISFQRSAHPMQVLGASALILLVFDTNQLYDVGFQLSYAALSGILICSSAIGRLFIFRQIILHRAWQLIAVSLAAQIFILPISAHYFHQISLLSVPASLVVIPLAYAIVVLGALVCLVEIVSSEIAGLIARLLELLMAFLQHTVDGFSTLGFGIFDHLFLPVPQTLCTIAGISMLLLFAFKGKIIRLHLAGFFLSMALVLQGLHLFQMRRQRSLVIYDTGRHVVVDIFAGRDCDSTHPGIKPNTDLGYHVLNHRIRRRVRHISGSAGNRMHTFLENGHACLVRVPASSKSTKPARHVVILPQGALTHQLPSNVPVDIIVQTGNGRLAKSKFLQYLPNHKSVTWHKISTDGAFILEENEN